MAQLVYGCRFDVPGKVGWETIVRPRYERWISDRYRKAFDSAVSIDLERAEVSGLLPDGHSLTIRRHTADIIATEIDWRFPGEDGLIWRNSIRAAQLEDRCALEHRVEIESSQYVVSPAGYSVGAPAVVRIICQQFVLVGEMRVRATVYTLRVDGVDEFINLLEAEQRHLPIVLLTPFANGEPGDFDARSLADHLAGVAIVAEADSPETTRSLSECLGRLGCYDGGVRVYWPRFRVDDDLRRHPLLLSSRIGILGIDRAAQTVERLIFSVAAFRFTLDSRISAIVAASEATARAERAQEVVGKSDATWESYALEMSGSLDTALAQIQSLKSENDNLRANQSVLFNMSADDSDQEEIDQIVEDREPKNVTEAVNFAKIDCLNLTFLESSFASAADSPFKRAGDIYAALKTMDKVAEVWARNRGGGDLRQMLKEAGLGKRVSSFVSQTSKGKWGSEYTFNYDGEDRLFEAHVTLGSGAADFCASIHFLPDREKWKIVIGHVGRHLTNTRS